MSKLRKPSPCPGIEGESKVARYIKHGKIDLKNEESQKLTASVYLRNIKTAQGNERLIYDKN